MWSFAVRKEACFVSAMSLNFQIFEITSLLSVDTVLGFCLPSWVILTLNLNISGPLLPCLWKASEGTLTMSLSQGCYEKRRDNI